MRRARQPGVFESKGRHGWCFISSEVLNSIFSGSKANHQRVNIFIIGLRMVSL